MAPESTAHQLWHRARAGDPSAYDELFRLHADRALIFIRTRLGMLREKVEPEDVLQDAFLAAHRSFSDFEYTGDGAFLRWLCRIIENRLRDAHDHFSARKRQETFLPRSAPTGPITALARKESSEKVERALAAISEEHRTVLLLRHFEGLSAEEAGARMGRSPGAIRNLAARALAELGRQLAPLEGAGSVSSTPAVDCTRPSEAP
jgi:RNA polymerase sigma-70 factor (ECF subfamily)